MKEQHNRTPREIVKELDRYIIGQDAAKKAIAVALRNRYRRQKLDADMQKEVTPKNILMIGPTGVGKTELARRLALLVEAPFVKVEATKFTEVGYVGRDVESMVRDLMENAIQIVEKQKRSDVYAKAYEAALERLSKVMRPGTKKAKPKQEGMNDWQNMFKNLGMPLPESQEEEVEEVTAEIAKSRAEIIEQLRKGLLNKREVSIKVEEKQANPLGGGGNNEQMMMLQSAFESMTPKKKIQRTLLVEDAIEVLVQEETDKLVNKDDISQEALKLAETNGIIFIDEIDKITSKSQNSGEVSREGVQRDILPIVEGSQVSTKYGTLQTDHILFIASGAFHVSKPSDLIPELQGRFPIRVELNDLTEDDFVRILTEPNNAMLKQYTALLATEDVDITFTQEAIRKMAAIATEVNQETDNIGARRLHTIMEKLLEDLLFEASEIPGTEITITEHYVDEKLEKIVENKDLRRYIL
ncbi:MAG: ATP-dependent protease ATPase subunit HslU [Trichococcus flocculiformis]|jgi:ATP-dependent HslUV protease ATP-binding subunit HslU|uniref:ATP-dependent protease ATPase subunit HslU n=1 Tax=Trichococcus flocculiformis TaxID=82803 RepID=A0AB38BHJ7_9LACT|nr:ATP-dependent protease ATPase subunit HslU [Trichococcus flocculiformis]MBP6164625.1 ATP-dependent protease ATPase subunit HslU [Trichococcus sp.]NCB64961.1 ATP-dependent protease ATPase subunit HslU [Bacilli bacterium]MBP6246711.1 ATP-dependent protease ATPase subunit HslU [Trichococcus sp.]MBP7128188.1 ATP-dependent protease ATPase subunit HslU [Trichococcus sp.]MBP8682571.1 ATP-dependent protease ATPase subunit HslU [Trichococcus sp.]